MKLKFSLWSEDTSKTSGRIKFTCSARPVSVRVLVNTAQLHEGKEQWSLDPGCQLKYLTPGGQIQASFCFLALVQQEPVPCMPEGKYYWKKLISVYFFIIFLFMLTLVKHHSFIMHVHNQQCSPFGLSNHPHGQYSLCYFLNKRLNKQSRKARSLIGKSYLPIIASNGLFGDDYQMPHLN